jgi:hypothetical protein
VKGLGREEEFEFETIDTEESKREAGFLLKEEPRGIS